MQPSNQQSSDFYKGYIQVGGEQFDSFTAENACKMSSIAKDWNSFDYSQCDQQLTDALNANAQFRFHNLVWPNTNSYCSPSFIWNSNDTTRKEEFLMSYIQQTLQRYQNTSIYAVDVVNELYDNNGNIRADNPWSSIDDFLCKAFKAARLANPNIQLYYNDYNFESSVGWMKTKSDAIFERIRDAKLRGNDCPIDGVGFQTHINIGYSDTFIQGVRTNVQRYADIGVKVQFTEVDIKCRMDWTTNTCQSQTWTADDLTRQADMYKQLLTICLEEPNCDSFTTWGYTDAYSWLSAPQYGLPFDS